VTVSRSGTSTDLFGQLCAAGSPPLPTIDPMGVGLAACGTVDGRYVNLWVQVDATTTVISVSSTAGGTQAQALDVVRAVAGRLPPR